MNTITKEMKDFKLRHSMGPLVVYPIFFVVIGYFAVQGGGIWWLFILFAVLCFFIFLILWHSVSYRNETITGVLFPHSPVSIKVSEITNIRREMDIFRLETRMCIAIHDERNKKVVKVSLSLFIRDDINKLMKIIHEARPELEMPEGWN
jgi:hypothetical protein